MHVFLRFASLHAIAAKAAPTVFSSGWMTTFGGESNQSTQRICFRLEDEVEIAGTVCSVAVNTAFFLFVSGLLASVRVAQRKTT